jgi:hypothetical protein
VPTDGAVKLILSKPVRQFGNGEINIDDLLWVINQFEQTPPESRRGDVNFDGIIDIEDLMRILQALANGGVCPRQLI